MAQSKAQKPLVQQNGKILILAIYGKIRNFSTLAELRILTNSFSEPLSTSFKFMASQPTAHFQRVCTEN